MNLFSVPISITSKSKALALVTRWVTKGKGKREKGKGFASESFIDLLPSSFYPLPSSLSPKVITTPNPEMIVAAQKDPEFLKALQSADLAIPDGIGIVWAVRIIQGRRTRDEGRIPFSLQPSAFSLCRLSGIEFMESLIGESVKHGWKVMLLGGKPGVAEAAVASLRRKFRIQNSEFRIKSINGPQDIFNISKLDNDRLVSEINSFSPDLLFVAFGHGKQEKWLVANRHRLNAGVAMGIGGALDQIADPSLRPPAYINSIGLGWLYRLLRQPWRWRRQLALAKFVGMVIKLKTQISKLKI